MENEFNYDDMRPYHDNEVKATLEKLTNEPEFIHVLKFLYPNMDIDKLIQQLRNLNSIKEFQLQIIGPLILSIVQKAKGVYTLNGMEQLSFDEKHLFISNHRDIVMDASLLNTLFAEKGYEPAFGARPMRRLIQREIEDSIANLILSGEAVKGDTILVEAKNQKAFVSVKKTEEKPKKNS